MKRQLLTNNNIILVYTKDICEDNMLNLQEGLSTLKKKEYFLFRIYNKGDDLSPKSILTSKIFIKIRVPPYHQEFYGNSKVQLHTKGLAGEL